MEGRIQAVRGMKDILPGEVETWQAVEALARKILEIYGFSEIRIPLLERTELFARSIGEATDIVEKEMYTFRDRSDISVTLRPEATAGILRAYIQHGLYRTQPFQKFYCIGPMFRYERPQKGRYRQFHQIDAEILGSPDPRCDAELLAMLRTLFEGMGLRELDFQINSLGCRSCRPSFKEAILSFLRDRETRLCEDCRRRLQINPLRIFDCKVPQCQENLRGAPQTLEHLCGPCRDHLESLERHLNSLEIPYTVNSLIVRGLDYYTRTIFEVISSDLGAQNAVCGGGRYDNLIEELGGPDMPAIGFAIGEERLVSLLLEGGRQRSRPPLDLFVVAVDARAESEAFLWLDRARRLGLRAETDLRGGSLKSQLRRAHKLSARRVLILGERELHQRRALLKAMDSGEQEEVPLDRLEAQMAEWVQGLREEK